MSLKNRLKSQTGVFLSKGKSLCNFDQREITQILSCFSKVKHRIKLYTTKMASISKTLENINWKNHHLFSSFLRMSVHISSLTATGNMDIIYQI